MTLNHLILFVDKRTSEWFQNLGQNTRYAHASSRSMSFLSHLARATFLKSMAMKLSAYTSSTITATKINPIHYLCIKLRRSARASEVREP